LLPNKPPPVDDPEPEKRDPVFPVLKMEVGLPAKGPPVAAFCKKSWEKAVG